MSADTTDLKIAVEEPRSWSRRLTVTVPAARIQRTRSTIASQLAGRVRLPGFRQGKLPQKIVEQKFGATIEQETLDRAIQDAYREALQSQGFVPITQGQVENVQYDQGSDLVFDVEFEVQPQIELQQLSGFSAERPSAEVGEEDVDNVLERLREERGVWRTVEDEGAKPDHGDQVTVDITALDPDGAPKAGEEARSYRFALGEGQAIPEVEESILQLTLGEERDFTVRFPEDFPDESQRGQEQFLRIKLNDIQRREFPDVDDEFAKSVGDFEDLAALRARVLTDLGEDAEQRAEAEVRRQLLDGILQANPFEIPDSMVERYVDYATGHSHADGEGEKHHHTPEEEERISQMRQALRPQAESVIKRMLVIDRLAEREGLRASQDEIDARVEEIAEKHDRTPGEVWLQLEKSGQLETLEREITEDKVFTYLKAQNTVA